MHTNVNNTQWTLIFKENGILFDWSRFVKKYKFDENRFYTYIYCPRSSLECELLLFEHYYVKRTMYKSNVY